MARWQFAAARAAAVIAAAALSVMPAQGATGSPQKSAKTAHVAGKSAKSAKPGKSTKAAKGASASSKKSKAAPPPAESIHFLSMESSGLSGSASFYGHGFTGRKVASGERFDVRDFTAASNVFPLGSWVVVHRLDNDRCAVVKINDRMGTHRSRIIDLSRAAAEHLRMISAGVVMVRVTPLRSRHEKGGGATDRACSRALEAAEVLPEKSSAANDLSLDTNFSGGRLSEPASGSVESGK